MTARATGKLPVKKKTPKKSLKPPVKLKPSKSTGKTIDPSLVQVGVITHYFARIKVCVVNLSQGTVLIGDKLTILGPKTKFVQKVWSMQIESEDVKVAKKGQLIGLKVDKAVVVGDKVYK
jgi:translation initiation factor IF-2